MFWRLAGLFLLWTAGTAAAEGPLLLPRLGPANFNAEEINACIEASCGPASSYTSSFNVFEKRVTATPENSKELWKKEVHPLLLSHAKSKSEFQKAMSDRMSFAQSSGRTPPPFHPLLILARKNLLLRSLQLENVMKDPSLQEAVKNLSPEKKEAAIALITKLVVPMKRLSAVKVKNPGASLEARLRLLYRTLPISLAQQKDAAQILEMRRQLAGLFDPLTLQLLLTKDDEEVFLRALNGSSLNSFDSDLYFEGAMEIESLGKIFLDPALLSLLSKINLEDGDLSSPTRGKSPSLKFFGLDGNPNSNTSAEALNKESEFCLRRFSASQGLNSSALQLRKTQEIIAKVKVAAKSALAKMWDAKNPDSSDAIIDAINFQFAEPQGAYLKRFQSLLAMKQKRNLETAKVLQDLSNQKTDETLVALMTLAATTPDPKNEDSELRSACEVFPIAGATDYTLPWAGTVSVSWFASSYFEFSAGIIAHEIGHIVSDAMITQYQRGNFIENFLRLRTCVTNRNPYLLQMQFIENLKDSPWIEEDFADFFSSRVLNELAQTEKFPADSKNWGCSLIDNRKGTYAAIKDMEPQKDGIHPSGFLRLLMIGVDRGTLPPQCRKFLDYAAANNRSLTCQ